MPRVGGADAITVLPYDTVLGLPERFGRRLARNTQILLADESNVGRVTDPGGGSWYLESLTDQVADAVWARFQEVERAGGAVRALADGLLHELGRQAATERDARDRHPAPPAHGRVDVPGDGRTAPRAGPARRPGGHRPRAGSATRRDGIRDAARPSPGPRRPRSSIVRTLGTRRDFGARQRLRRQPPRRGRHPRHRRSAHRSRSWPPARAGMPTRRPPRSPTCAPPASSACSSPAGPVSWARTLDLVDGEIYDGMDVVAFLDDLLDARSRAPAPPAPDGEQ